MPPNIGEVAELLEFDGPFVEFRQASPALMRWCSRTDYYGQVRGQWRSWIRNL